MNASQRPSASSSNSLAISCLALGILALLLKIAAASALAALLGLILGILHLKQAGTPKATAIAGIGIAAIALLLAGSKGERSRSGSILSLPLQPAEFEIPSSNSTPELERAGSPLDAWVGVPVPDLTVTTLKGESIRLSNLKGKRIILDFWATWCPPCVMEIPHFIELRKQAKEEDLVIVGLTQETPEELQPFVKEHGINYPIAPVAELPRPFSDIEGIPTTFFIDRKGIIQRVLVGYHDLEGLRSEALAPDYPGTPKPAPTGP